MQVTQFKITQLTVSEILFEMLYREFSLQQNTNKKNVRNFKEKFVMI